MVYIYRLCLWLCSDHSLQCYNVEWGHIFLLKESHRGPDLSITIAVFVMFFKSRLVLSLDLDFRRVMILKSTTTASTGTTTSTTTTTTID